MNRDKNRDMNRDLVHTIGVALALLFSPFLLPLFLHAPAAFAEKPPNILLLVAEDLSLRVGAFGDKLAHTPNIDTLAAQGQRFTRVFTTAGVCAPSRAALITGQHQISFGAHHMRSSTGPLGEYFAQPDTEVRAFPELLRQHGYFTFTDTKLDYQFSGIRSGTGPFTIWDVDGAADDAWRLRDPGQPFFGMINFIETHESGVMRQSGEPHSPTHGVTQQMRAAFTARVTTRTDPGAVSLEPYYPDLPEVRADIARHYDNIRIMDERVGHIMAALRADGLDPDTIVIWTTDHGDGLPRAKRDLYDSGIHVPMVLVQPDGVAAVGATEQGALAGTVDERLVSFVDLAPTILTWAGITPPSWLHGRALQSATLRSYIYASRDRIDEVQDRQRAVRDERFKLIRSWHPEVPGGHQLAYRDNLDMVRAWRLAHEQQRLTVVQRRWFEPAGEYQLYDTQADPHELTNLAGKPAYAEVLHRLDAALTVHLRRVGDLGELPEAHLRANYLVDGNVPVTPAPEVRREGGLLHARSPIGASIGYRVGSGQRWRLYVAPLAEQSAEFKSVRYGWRDSPVVAYPATAYP